MAIDGINASPVRGRRTSLIDSYRRAREDQMLRRDSDVMGLTVCIALIAALTAGSDTAPHSKLDVLVVVWGTTIGLALTHWFAMIVASRMVSSRERVVDPLAALISQTATASMVAIAATVAALIVSSRFDRLAARLVAALFMAGMVVIEVRRNETSTGRVVVSSIVFSATGILVALLNWFIS